MSFLHYPIDVYDLHEGILWLLFPSLIYFNFVLYWSIFNLFICRLGSLLGLGLCLSAMCEDGKTDSRVHILSALEQMSAMLDGGTDSETDIQQGMALAFASTSANAFRCNLIDMEVVNQHVAKIYQLHMQDTSVRKHPYNYIFIFFYILHIFLCNPTGMYADNLESTLIQVVACCHQATSHYLSQYWPRAILPYGATRSQWIYLSMSFSILRLQWVKCPNHHNSACLMTICLSILLANLCCISHRITIYIISECGYDCQPGADVRLLAEGRPPDSGRSFSNSHGVLGQGCGWHGEQGTILLLAFHLQ